MFPYILSSFHYLVKQTMKNFAEQRGRNLKVVQEKMKLNEKQVKRFNPVSLIMSLIMMLLNN